MTTRHGLSNINNDGVTMNQNHHHHFPRKSKRQSSISLLNIVGLFIILFLLGMLTTIFYSHYVLIQNDNNNCSNNGNHKFLMLSQPKTASNSYDTYLACQQEYQRVMSNITTNLTKDDYDRSIAHVGNRYRLSRIVNQKLLVQSNRAIPQERLPLTIVVCGGSITLGHGITPVSSRYSNQLEMYLNSVYPTKQKLHKVYNRGSHGADVSIVEMGYATMKIKESKHHPSNFLYVCLSSLYLSSNVLDVCNGETYEFFRYTE